MFTGIIEQTATITDIQENGSNKTFTLRSDIARELKVDQSVSHNGVCLTVETTDGDQYTVTAIRETLYITTGKNWKTGDKLNLERCLRFDGRLDGHIVQGHTDTTAQCISVTDKIGSWEYRFRINEKFAALIIEKGSIALNGISLTIFGLSKNEFTVAVIPYTYEHTNMHLLKENDEVNIEFDMIGKYINRMQNINNAPVENPPH